ncbi:hypothetical protein I315_04510 [Cryptococcus gattii Ru294]|nr:hypothetical protein I315_04510 [Cryptococcus gattii Ru294]
MGEATQYSSRDKRQTAQKIHRDDQDELGGVIPIVKIMLSMSRRR